ncbi:MAG: hypothetical protein LQ349_009584, partial [Xanthoria aureola]
TAEPPASGSGFVSVNVLLDWDPSPVGGPQPAHGPPARGVIDDGGDPTFASYNFLADCCSMVAAGGGYQHRALKFLLPVRDGYVNKGDFLEQRLVDGPRVDQVKSFCQPRQYLRCLNTEQMEWSGLAQIISHAAGGILLRDRSLARSIPALVDLDSELVDKISYPWMSERPIAKATVASVDIRERMATEPMLHAARSLGIEVVILGEPGHWLEGPSYAHLRSQFLQMDTKADEEMPSSIILALSKCHGRIDGLTSKMDWMTYPVSMAAAVLGLPRENLQALDVCRDKYKQRMASGDAAVQVHKGEDPRVVLDGSLEFPLVVKPSLGANSEGVSKVFDQDELAMAVDRVFQSDYEHVPKSRAVNVEEYCAGPEIDVNFVLMDGEVLFVETADDFPKAADNDEGSNPTVFKESAMVYPSGLPPGEIEAVQSSLRQTLHRIGLRNGIYHVEARVENSTMEYRRNLDGCFDLESKADTDRPTAEPKAVLIEINPRLPGSMVKAAVLRTYGVDYDALSLLLAIGDKERAVALSQPFRAGPQYWSSALFISTDRGGKLVSGDMVQELRQRRPDLASH